MKKMTSPQFYTATMAKIYADQGYLRKAAQIYEYLLQKEPLRHDLKRALEEVQVQIDEQGGPTQKELGLLCKEWVGLLKRQKKNNRDERKQQRREK